MQDRYAGDVGDFGKFSLLKYLFDRPQDKIGVIWYLFPDESHNKDGRHTSYLMNPDFSNCDKDLCERLSTVVRDGRSVSALERAGILPPNTVYFSERLDFHIQHASQRRQERLQREEKRKQWLESAVLAVAECNMIFLDPDNGLEVTSCSGIGQVKSGKYAYYNEILNLNKGKDVTVIYHHLCRKGNHTDQIHLKASLLRENINPTGKIFAVRYRPFSPRAYFILTAKSAEKRIREKLQSFSGSRYGKHWDSYYEESIDGFGNYWRCLAR